MEVFKDMIFQSESRSRLKSLRGFEKRGKPPEKGGDQASRWLAEIADLDLRDDIERRFSRFREGFGFRRKQMETEIEGCKGTIRTPHFDYEVTVDFDGTDLTTVVWRRSLHRAADLALLESEAFRRVFCDEFDTLLCHVSRELDLAEVIDRIEENPKPGFRLDYDSACTWCELHAEGFSGILRVEAGFIRVGGRCMDPASLARLLGEWRGFFSGPSLLAGP